ncbi:MAG: hypothetical protein A2X61_10525 [Ignavibacteria bacterium GWB2_35_12]|nr:MAG: hypothetical protein A2X63_03385 [Ignavibacteria bacterium GWA2_35_8]OGU42073.1 MAG: hypothetical protein A2X61_10525 [Ignavibacteria bacterium GWB2_35_12]OGU92630.1 MAG: hypothetical protein A2220_03765 [Ignavibacteria bacterium RIFOXYA2_FULL_35_10]OGV24851.1 MAG: hypothetical protein A2475_02865 [Ignavibacteria bacterium RIFOXYC2_FULL_35_21]
MRHKTKTSRILLTLAALGFFIWFGGSVIRTAVAYDLFEPGSALTIKSYYSDLQKMETVRLFAVGALYTDIAYGVALVSSIILCAYWKQYLKKRGWLFMAFVLVFISAPIELVLIYLDMELNLGLYFGNELIKFTDNVVNNYFMFRFTKMAIPSAMSFLAFITAIIFIVWRPLDKSKKEYEPNEWDDDVNDYEVENEA